VSAHDPGGVTSLAEGPQQQLQFAALFVGQVGLVAHGGEISRECVVCAAGAVRVLNELARELVISLPATFVEQIDRIRLGIISARGRGRSSTDTQNLSPHVDLPDRGSAKQ
jgi:hypothetical protein